MKLFVERLFHSRSQKNLSAGPVEYWSLTTEQLFSALHTTNNGLGQTDAEQRLQQHGANTIRDKQRSTMPRLLLNQVRSPLVLILIFAATEDGINDAPALHAADVGVSVDTACCQGGRRFCADETGLIPTLFKNRDVFSLCHSCESRNPSNYPSISISQNLLNLK